MVSFHFLLATFIKYDTLSLPYTRICFIKLILHIRFSAGGVGVMLNLDPIQKMLRQYSGMSVHGITDSGWFVDQPPYDFEDEADATPSPVEAVKRGIPYWHSQIPSRCRNLYINEPSKCFIGYKIYPTLSGEYLNVPVYLPNQRHGSFKSIQTYYTVIIRIPVSGFRRF